MNCDIPFSAGSPFLEVAAFPIVSVSTFDSQSFQFFVSFENKTNWTFESANTHYLSYVAADFRDPYFQIQRKNILIHFFSLVTQTNHGLFIFVIWFSSKLFSILFKWKKWFDRLFQFFLATQITPNGNRAVWTKNLTDFCKRFFFSILLFFPF